VGDASNNELQGTSQADVLDGAAGDDVLDGLGGADTLIGGTGDDIYIATNRDVRVVEASSAAGGKDLLITTVNQVLRSGVDDVILLGDAVNARGNALANVIQGNALANRLEGLGGNDTLLGQAGDTLLGGDGNDLLINETIYANYWGEAPATLSGDAGDDRLIGARGDLLSGGSGNDLLVGYEGRATLIGGAGSDRFVVADPFRLNSSGYTFERNTVSDFVASGPNADKLLLVGVTIPTGLASSTAATYGDLSFVQQYGGTDVRVADQSVAFLKGVNTGSLVASSTGNVQLLSALPELDSVISNPVRQPAV
jgi:Ca2+-binding RTX toxin-like protein